MSLVVYLVVGSAISTLVVACCGWVSCRWGMWSLGRAITRDGLDFDVMAGVLGAIVGAYCVWRRAYPEATVLLGVAHGVAMWQMLRRVQTVGAHRARAERGEEAGAGEER